jgi:hypothetical protein
MRTKSYLHFIGSLFLVFTIVTGTLVTTGCPSNSNNANSNTTGLTLEQRVVRAVGAIPGVVRSLFPSLAPDVMGVLDAAGSAYNAFFVNPTSSNWQNAQNAWAEAKPKLLSLESQTVRDIVAAVDVLDTQIIVPATIGSRSSGHVQVKFKESDVKHLEELVK